MDIGRQRTIFSLQNRLTRSLPSSRYAVNSSASNCATAANPFCVKHFSTTAVGRDESNFFNSVTEVSTLALKELYATNI